MSNLLEQASLVMIPSGYKEDVVYSEIPLDGSGDMSFTRSSNGTRVNSAGLVEVVPWNLLQQSNTFNTTWVSAGPGATTTSGQTDPNAGSNAWLLSKLGATGRIQQTVNVGGVQTFFIYAKKNTSDYILINVFDGTTSHECWFNLSTGAVGTQNSSTGAIESVGNGWYKCSVTSTNLFASGIIQIYQSDGNGNVTGASGSIYIFNSQLNIGSTAKPYFPTTDRLNVPRLTYQNGGGGCPSLLLEKQSTNLLSYSQDFTNAYWSKLNQGIGDVAVVTANYAISPDGTQNAWGAQAESGSYPTSYIPTTSSSATRVADACSKTGISSLIGQTSGSVFFDFTVDSVTQPSDPVLWYMKDGGSGERYVELYSNSNLVYAEIDGGGLIATITKSGLTVGRHKCAIAYATNDFVFYVDGVQIGTDTSGTPNGFSTFGLQYYLSTYTGSQKVNQCAIFKTRLTNAELASLTTI
jgi:hypothetical protein